MKIVALNRLIWNDKEKEIYDELKNLGDVTYYEKTGDDQVIDRVGGADAVIVTEALMDAYVMDRLKTLRYIGISATGFNRVDVGAALQRKIVVTNIPAYATESVSQMAIAVLLQLTCKLELYSDEVKKGNWKQTTPKCYSVNPFMELMGKTMGIVGYGKIGRRIGKIAKAFGMNIIAADNYVSQTPDATQVGLDELFRSSDVICLSCNLTPENEGIISKSTLSLMKPSAYLINPARGRLVVEKDLAEALNNGLIAGYGTDVLSKEPPDPDNPLLNARNCIITPHIYTATSDCRERLARTTVNNVKAFAEGRPENIVSVGRY